ncbi:Uncharacterised protein [Aggregatibacter aphrophilus]|uniref:Uncharacterized protein n=1 Tax=Aggregatibacter aphrophilus TaxID=732 RepID=A0A336N474_AGGAP|nr:Uncharacterised protein [Aggregatibacter aphrophilus]
MSLKEFFRAELDFLKKMVGISQRLTLTYLVFV